MNCVRKKATVETEGYWLTYVCVCAKCLSMTMLFTKFSTVHYCLNSRSINTFYTIHIWSMRFQDSIQFERFIDVICKTSFIHRQQNIKKSTMLQGTFIFSWKLTIELTVPWKRHFTFASADSFSELRWSIHLTSMPGVWHAYL